MEVAKEECRDQKERSTRDAFIFIESNDTSDGVSTESTPNYKQGGC